MEKLTLTVIIFGIKKTEVGEIACHDMHKNLNTRPLVSFIFVIYIYIYIYIYI